MSSLCGVLNKESAWETRSQSCIISFLGLSQETRKGPEGTLIRSQKKPKELDFSPMQRARNLLKPETASAVFTFPNRPRAHLSGASGTIHLQAPGLSPSELAPSFLSVQIPHLRLGSPLISSPEPLRGLSPIIFLIFSTSSTYIAQFTFLSYRGVHSQGMATSLGKEPFLERLLF